MFKPTLTVAVAATLLTACSGQSNDRVTMDLLKAGDAKICVANDVEEELRAMIIPKGRDTKNYPISFTGATLETFDKAVSKASCHVMLRIGDDVDLVPSTGIDFTVVPSAQDPDKFVVAASLGAFKARLIGALDNDAAHQNQESDRKAEESRMTALVKPGWLMGRWVLKDQGTDACGDGPYYEFAKGGRLNFGENTGRWKLAKFDLTMIGSAAAQTGWIDEADNASFSLRTADGSQTAFRRCSREESVSTFDPEPDEDTPDGSGIDAENPTKPAT